MNTKLIRAALNECELYLRRGVKVRLECMNGSVKLYLPNKTWAYFVDNKGWIDRTEVEG